MPGSDVPPSDVSRSDLRGSDLRGSDLRRLVGDLEPVRTRRLPERLVRAVLVVAAALVAGVLARVLLSDAGTVVVETAGAASARDPTPGASGGLLPSVSGTTGFTLSGSSVPSGPSVPSGSATPSDAAGVLVVHVVGKVRRPGLVTLAPGARVADAVTAAGGATSAAVLSRINLARRPVDGEQLVVPDADDPVPAAAAPSDGSGGSAGSAATGGSGGSGSGGGNGSGGAGLLDLNTATQADLEELPGIGPVTAEKIIAWRQAHQRFSRVDELGEVSGIGPKTLAQLTPLVRV